MPHLHPWWPGVGSGCLRSHRDRPLYPHRQYYWYDERGKKVKCTAPQYVDFVMSSVQKLVTDEDVFPTKYGTSLPCCTPPYWAAVAAYGKGPDLWDRDSCVTWTVKPGRCALAGVSLATPGSGTWSLCHPAPPPVPWGCCSPSHWGPDSQQAVATLHPDLAGGGSRPIQSSQGAALGRREVLVHLGSRPSLWPRPCRGPRACVREAHGTPGPSLHFGWPVAGSRAP